MGNYREESRQDWTRREGLTDREDIKTGALQRIADAAELMAKEHARLVAERDRYERWWREKRDECERMARSIYALRGTITRMKRRAAGKGPQQ